MRYLQVDHHQIPYKITKKKNKNTYFYFKKDGYIQINLSTYQSERDALNYIIENKSKFLYKLSNTSKKKPHNSNEFRLLGKSYDIILTQENKVEINDQLEKAYLPGIDINLNVIKSFYKEKMFDVINELKEKHKNNPYVDIQNVTYKTRYTSTRHGSCNARKRTINFNLHLIKYDVLYIEYVFLHEIAHLKHQNHSKEFYNLLEQLCPDYKIIRKNLREIYR